MTSEETPVIGKTYIGYFVNSDVAKDKENAPIYFTPVLSGLVQAHKLLYILNSKENSMH